MVRLRAQGDVEGLRQVVILGDDHRLLVRRHLQFAGRLACLALGGVDLGAQWVGFELQRLELFDEEFDDSAEEQPASETPTTAATTTESPTRDMTSLLPIFCPARLFVKGLKD